MAGAHDRRDGQPDRRTTREHNAMLASRWRHNYLSTVRKIYLSRKKNQSPTGGHFDYRWETENLIRSSTHE